MGARKIDPSRYPEIMERFSRGETGKVIAAYFGVTDATIYELRKKLALKGNGGAVDIIKPKNVGLRSFINRASDTSIDAEAWRFVKTETEMERQLAIDAAERASSAWKSAAINIAREKENG